MKSKVMLWIVLATGGAWTLHSFIVAEIFKHPPGFLVPWYLSFFVLALVDTWLFGMLQARNADRIGAVFLLTGTLRMLGFLGVLLVLKVRYTLHVFAAVNAVSIYTFFLLLSVLTALPFLKQGKKEL
jgi:hypothetical protein